MRWHIKTQETTPHHHHTDTSHSHFQHLLANLHLFIDSRVFEELHAEIALPQGRVTLHAVARAAHEQHLHAVLASGSGDREYHQDEWGVSPEVTPAVTPGSVVKSVRVCVGDDETIFLREKQSCEFLFPASASHHQGQRLIIGDMKRSSKCSKEQGVMIGQMACL